MSARTLAEIVAFLRAVEVSGGGVGEEVPGAEMSHLLPASPPGYAP